ncbi:MAG: hypothetical protein RSG96_09450, partial [Clostridia bacterium]
PAAITFYYVTMPAPVVTGKVTFQYKSTSGKQLEEPLTVELEAGDPHPTAEYAAAPAGYTLQGVSADTVTVSSTGQANPATVVFTYTEIQSNAIVAVHYVNVLGEELNGSPELLPLGRGSHNVVPNPKYIPTGYSPLSGSPTYQPVTVDEQYIATPASVTFSYVDNSKTTPITVIYQDTTTGTAITTQKVLLPYGDHVVKPDPTVLNGNYTMADASPTSYNIKVDAKGVASLSTVYFFYRPTQITEYMGYAVTTQQTALRSGMNTIDSNITKMLAKGTLLNITGQRTSGSVLWDGAQIVLGSDKSLSGYVLDSHTRHIGKAEADALIKQYEASNPTNPQNSGFYITLGSSIPLRRVASPNAVVD